MRIKEAEALRDCLLERRDAAIPKRPCGKVLAAIQSHLDGARDAALGKWPDGSRWPWSFWMRIRTRVQGSDVERAMYNITAAEAQLLRIAPLSHIQSVMPALLAHVRNHLLLDDPRRTQMEEVAQDARKRPLKEEDRDFVVAAVRAADLENRAEVMRVRSFRNILLASAFLLIILALGLALFTIREPTVLPLCFAPQEPGKTEMVCPTRGDVVVEEGSSATTTTPNVEQLDAAIDKTVRPWDVPLVQIIGALAAAVAAAGAIRKAKGTSTPYSVPVALALLKLPLGALTAVLGLVLMRAQFVPGLSALDTSAQILGWAAVFGYAQQLFTRFVDQRANAVLNDVGSNTLNRVPAK